MSARMKGRTMYKMGLIQLMKKLKLAVFQPDDPFEFPSGEKTPYGFDTRATLMCGDTAALVFSILMKRLMKLQPSYIGGRGEGALLMTAIAAVGYQRCRGFVFRGSWVSDDEDALAAGRLPKKPSKIVLVADVLTTGRGLKPIVEEMDAAKHEIMAIIPLLDRLGEVGEPDELGKFRELVQPILVLSDFNFEQDG